MRVSSCRFTTNGCLKFDIALEALTALKVSETPVDVFSTPPQLDGELITLTLLPRSRWQTLLNLELIQVGLYVFQDFLNLELTTSCPP